MKKWKKCDICGTDLGYIGRGNPHCLADECVREFARRRAFDPKRIKKVGDCEVWTGAIASKGDTPIVTLRPGGKRTDFRVIQLRDPNGSEEATYRRYINRCGTPRCVVPEHHYLQKSPNGPSYQILAHLPLEPIENYLAQHKEVVLGVQASHLLFKARKNGYFSVTGADKFCIDVLGIHPAFLYGEEFYTAGLEEIAA